MKKYILIIIILITNISFGQVYFDKSNFDNQVDYTSNKIKMTYKGNLIEGSFQMMTGKDYYEYMVVNGTNNFHSIIKPLGKDSFGLIEIVKGDYQTFLKEFKKGRKYKKTEIILSEEIPIGDLYFVSRMEKDMIVERQKMKEEKEANDGIRMQKLKENAKKWEGVYKIKINRSSGISLTEEYGKLYITENGITLKSEVIGLTEVRGSYSTPLLDVEDDMLFGNVSTYGNTFVLSIKESGVDSSVGVAGLTIMIGRNTDTHTMILQEKLD